MVLDDGPDQDRVRGPGRVVALVDADRVVEAEDAGGAGAVCCTITSAYSSSLSAYHGGKVNVQDTQAQQRPQQHLLPAAHLQLPQQHGRQAARDEVLRDRHGVGRHGRRGLVHAAVRVARRPHDRKLQPVRRERVARQQQHDGEGEQVRADERDVGLHDEQERRRVGAAPQPPVEEEDRDFGEAGAGRVEEFDGEHYLQGSDQLGDKAVMLRAGLVQVEWNADLSRLERYWLGDVPDVSVVSVETKSCQDGISIIRVDVLPNAKKARRDDGPRIIQVSTPVANNYMEIT